MSYGYNDARSRARCTIRIFERSSSGYGSAPFKPNQNAENCSNSPVQYRVRFVLIIVNHNNIQFTRSEVTFVSRPLNLIVL